MPGQSAIVEALGVAVAARVPVLLWGPPGSGKTSALKAMAHAMGWPIEVVIASIREPSDFAGLPVVIQGEPSALGALPPMKLPVTVNWLPDPLLM